MQTDMKTDYDKYKAAVDGSQAARTLTVIQIAPLKATYGISFLMSNYQY